MNYSLAREIYGGQPWLIDPVSFSSLFNILSDLRKGVVLENNDSEKLNSISYLQTNSAVKTVTRGYQLNNLDSDAEVISVINLNGPITKGGGMSSYGMKELSMNMDNMTKDSRVKGHILVTDSGGGASNAVGFMSDSIKKSQAAGKPVVQFIEKGGLSASAAFFIGSYSNFIYSESPQNIVGSLGTMIEFRGIPKGAVKGEDGIVNVRAYATASVKKNHEFEEALQGNLEPVISEVLDPVNEFFLSEIRSNRPNVKKKHLNGSTFRAEQVVGSLIDAIGTFDDAVNKVLELSNNNSDVAGQPVNKLSLTNNKDEMDLNKLKSEHPAVYQAAFAEGLEQGVLNERDRVGSWMAHSKTDPEAVKAGIDSGKAITATQREEMLVKGASLTHVANLKSDSAGAVVTEQATTGEGNEEAKEVENFYGEIDAKLGLTSKIK